MKNIRALPKGIKHSFWSILDAAVYPAVYLATVPVMMHYMGLVTFGFWILLNTLITFLQFCNLNIGVAALRNVSFEIGRNDLKRLKDTINGILQITLLLFLAVSVIGIALSYFAVKQQWWGLDAIQPQRAMLCIALAGVITGLKFLDQVFQNIIKGDEQFKTASILNMINRFGLLIINLVLVVYGFHIEYLLAANIIFICLYLIAQFLVIKKHFPFYGPGKVRNKSIFKSLLSYSIWPWLQSIFVIITFQTDKLWVSAFAGLKEVGSYGLTATMFNHIHMIFTAGVIWILPRIASIVSKGDNPSLLYHDVRSALFCVTTISLLFFYFISPAIFRLWLGGHTYEGIQVYIKAFVAFEIIFAHTIMPILYLNAAGKEKVATMVTLLFCSGCYLFMISGLYIFKTPVALVDGMTLSLCFTMPIVNYVVQKNIGKTASWRLSISEMLPMYASILLLLTNNVWIGALLVAAVVVLLWKYYLANVINRRYGIG